MKTNFQIWGHLSVGVIYVLVVISLAFSAQAQTSFQANLDGTQEVPPNASPGFGFADFTYNPVTMTLSVDAGTGQYAGLLGGATSVRIGDAPAGMNGGSPFHLTLDTPGNTSGTFEGSFTLTNMVEVANLKAGDFYVNISDSVFPGGEIRGQIIAVPEPVTMSLAGVGALALLAVRRKKT